MAAQRFQQEPRPLDLRWVRAEHGSFLQLLARIPDREERGQAFHDYVERRFGVDAALPGGRRRHHSVVTLLRGWGLDSNGASGAVLKGWAEERFGLRAIFHGVRLEGAADAHEAYGAERMRGMLTGLAHQLDVLYAFCQDELARRWPGQRWLRLYRGTHDAERYVVKGVPLAGADLSGPWCAGYPARRPWQLVEFNAISSFSTDVEVAWAFGSRVWAVPVPIAKIVFFSGLLPRSILHGEDEVLVLGGDYLVQEIVA
jgi:NAD+--dinitrogen-reductase ADP-D-ribosyltransferase